MDHHRCLISELRSGVPIAVDDGDDGARRLQLGFELDPTTEGQGLRVRSLPGATSPPYESIAYGVAPSGMTNIHQKADVPATAQPAGLLSAQEAELRQASEAVLRCAPKEFGTLNQLYLRGQGALPRDDWMLLSAMIIESIRAAAKAGDGDRDRKLPSDAAVALKERVGETQGFLSRREGETARRLYAKELLVGVGVSMAVLFTIAVVTLVVFSLWLGPAIPLQQVDALRDVLVTVGGGAAGACVSVLLRLHRMEDLTVEAVKSGAALYRIVLGWFFAAAVIFLLKSGLLSQIVVIPDPNQDGAARVTTWFFWGAVGFLAGFNERWATNLITRAPGGSLRQVADGTPPAAAPDQRARGTLATNTAP